MLKAFQSIPDLFGSTDEIGDDDMDIIEDNILQQESDQQEQQETISDENVVIIAFFFKFWPSHSKGAFRIY